MAKERDATYLGAFRVSVQFLTRVPVPGGNQLATREELRLAAGFFPLVGCLIGACTGLVYLGALHLYTPLLAAFLALAVEALVTGAFHEDALADVGDAFGGGISPEDVLRIMKDSRLGTFGALSLMMGVLIRGLAIASLPTDQALPFLVFSAGLGRAAILAAMNLVAPVANRESLSKDVAALASMRMVLGGAALLAPALLWSCSLALLPSLAALALGLLTAWGISARSRARIGGVTGDVLGTVAYVAQTMALLALVAHP